ncbi:hypothetical protein ENUP19_0047G0064 [Entamoeba nuttalli]|uniref:Uncharacterized protein n=1 Tax=Entamoeba nuttalli TaxID=412467 RepID=A0ABQ0DAX4_9EUKA
MTEIRKREIDEYKNNKENNKNEHPLIELDGKKENDGSWSLYCKEISYVLFLSLIPTIVFSILMALFIIYLNYNKKE